MLHFNVFDVTAIEKLSFVVARFYGSGTGFKRPRSRAGSVFGAYYSNKVEQVTFEGDNKVQQCSQARAKGPSSRCPERPRDCSDFCLNASPLNAPIRSRSSADTRFSPRGEKTHSPRSSSPSCGNDTMRCYK